MTFVALDKAYDAKKYEDKIYKEWEESGLFKPKMKKGAKPFTIMMPPPNATGTLHLGHAIMLALEDIMIRFKRMRGFAALWVPGTDHASIASQNKVEKILAEEGITRHFLGREEFLKRVNEFVEGSRTTIRKQIRKMGSSCDWSRECYTLSPELSVAVREIFVQMYKDGLIYRGHRIVNWCPRCASTLADDEVEYKEEKAKFYYLKYGPFVIGTARPETKFADKVIVVHPDDKRYKKFIGKKMTVKWIEGDVEATILADKSADPEFGTGAMTITPAHDFIDFEIAKRHGLEILQIIDEKGNLTAAAGSFVGKSARESREAIIAKLAEKGLVEKIDENYVHNVSLCYRCSTPIEPLVSQQWFIDVNKKFRKGKSLKDIAISVVRSGKIKIIPERFEKTYFHWMENLHDWCISRQIWFGHQIPVWYCVGDETEGGACKMECKDPIVATKAPKKCPHCGSVKLMQDPDTLDTWFSAGLWTFSTLGWPKADASIKKQVSSIGDLKFFHPTDVLETGYDILFFWIARMVLMTTYAMDEVPFKNVYLHGLVRTREGKKMSKSDPASCIDPLDMIKKYGADALRLSMVIGSAPGNDIRLYEEKIAGFRNFVNKIWNAARFSLMQRDAKAATKNNAKLIKPKTLEDKWILSRTQSIIKEVTEDLNAFRFSEAGTKIYDFTWGEYCAWYLETSKGKETNLGVLTYVMKTILQLLHPFIPYVTEVLWSEFEKKTMLISESWPKPIAKFAFKKEAQTMNILIETIGAIRNLRQENRLDITKKISAILVSNEWTKLLTEKRDTIMQLSRLEKLELATSAPKAGKCLKKLTKSGIEVLLPVKELIDLSTELKRLNDEKENIEQYISIMQGKLNNKNFTDRAPAEIVAAEKAKFVAAKEKLDHITTQIKALE